MSDLQNLPFLNIDDQPLSLGQLLQYLQVSGNLLPFLQEIVGQHVIYQEIQARQDLEVSASQLVSGLAQLRSQIIAGASSELNTFSQPFYSASCAKK